MPAPTPTNHGPDVTHVVVIIFHGPTNMRSDLNPYGTFVGNVIDIEGYNTHCFITDPRYGVQPICDYIEEMGGTVYNRPPDVP